MTNHNITCQFQLQFVLKPPLLIFCTLHGDWLATETDALTINDTIFGLKRMHVLYDVQSTKIKIFGARMKE